MLRITEILYMHMCSAVSGCWDCGLHELVSDVKLFEGQCMNIRMHPNVAGVGWGTREMLKLMLVCLYCMHAVHALAFNKLSNSCTFISSAT